MRGAGAIAAAAAAWFDLPEPSRPSPKDFVSAATEQRALRDDTQARTK
jgi:hypothetical protein